jgi:hypothetical protein
MNAADFKNVCPSTLCERQLVAGVRNLAEGEAYEFVSELVQFNLKVGLAVATKALRDPKLLRKFFNHGLSTANASNVRFWLESFVPRLGLRETVKVLHMRLDTDPVSVEKAVYFLLSFVKHSRADKKRVLELQHLLNQRLVC